MGSVEELPSGRWRGVARNAITGKRWSKAHDRWADADAWWRREERDADGSYTAASLDVTRQQRGIPRFAEHMVAWARTGIADPELVTRRGYQGQTRMLALRWPTERVDEITEKMIRDYMADLREAGASPSTRTLRLTVLRHAMRDTVAAGHRPDDPTFRIKEPKRREHQARLLSEQELMVVLVCGLQPLQFQRVQVGATTWHVIEQVVPATAGGRVHGDQCPTTSAALALRSPPRRGSSSGGTPRGIGEGYPARRGSGWWLTTRRRLARVLG